MKRQDNYEPQKHIKTKEKVTFLNEHVKISEQFHK